MLAAMTRSGPSSLLSSRGVRHRGFTLIELIVTIAVAAILASLAAPSFRQFILSQRIKNASYDVISALSLARSEAIARNGTVNMIASGGAWGSGWCVTTDTTCGTANQLFTHEAFNAGIGIDAVLTGTTNPGPTTITYGLNGRATTASTVFTISPTTALNGVINRYVTICLSGLPRSTTNAGGC